MVLSKRWLPLWKSVPKLVYDDHSYQSIEYGRFSRFVDRSLIVHEAPVDTLRFKLVQNSGAAEIGIWITLAAKCRVRDLILKIDCSSSTTPVILPRSLYRGSGMLVTLRLRSVTLVCAASLPSFTSLKKLSLVHVKYQGGDEFVKRLLSSCLVLQDLAVHRCQNDDVAIFTVIAPSLKSLSLAVDSGKREGRGFVIDAPLLEDFHIVVYNGGFFVIENNMPRVIKANVCFSRSHPGNMMGYITSVKRLSLCLSTSKDVYPVGSVFRRLVHVEICTCKTEWLNLLLLVLSHSPNLQSLSVGMFHHVIYLRPRWNEPSSVPECLLSSLETLEWAGYEGRKEEKELAAFILRKANCLKKAVISSITTKSKKKLKMLKELSSSPRRSPTCQLVFN